MRLDVFGAFQVDLVRQGDRWLVLRVGQGISAPLDVVVPSELDEAGAVQFLEDLWHEAARPGQRIRPAR